MKILRSIITLCLLLIICSCNKDLPGFKFESFENTKAEKLANAVKNQNTNDIEKIIKDDPNIIDFRESTYGHSLLMIAVANNLKISVEKLLKLGANPNLRSKPEDDNTTEITTPIFIATNDIYNKSNCNTDVLELLVEYGGNVNDTLHVKYIGANYIAKDSPLLIAAGSKCKNVLKKLIDLGADINQFDYKEGHGPISRAIVQDRLENLKYLIIDKKANIPKYCYVIHAYNESPRIEYTLTEFLSKQDYKENSNEFKIRSEILKYLKVNNLN